MYFLYGNNLIYYDGKLEQFAGMNCLKYKFKNEIIEVLQLDFVEELDELLNNLSEVDFLVIYQLGENYNLVEVK
jgi:hypothetical protein